MKIKLFISALLTLLLAVGCADIKKLEDLEVVSVKVENIIPNGLRGVGLVLSVEVDNPGAELSLSEISALLEHSGKVLGRVAVDPFTLQGKTTDTYRLEADLTLGENATILDLGRLLDKKTLENALVDVSAKVRIKKSPAKRIELNDIPLKKLIDAVR